jgi:hypothetical protein
MIPRRHPSVGTAILQRHGDTHHHHNLCRPVLHRPIATMITAGTPQPHLRPTMMRHGRPTTAIRWFGGDMSSTSSSSSLSDRAFEGVSEEVSKRIHHHAHQPQTAVSLKTLLQTGRGEFLRRAYKNLDEDNNHRGATGKVLIQVSREYCGVGILGKEGGPTNFVCARVLVCLGSHNQLLVVWTAFAYTCCMAFKWF